MLAYALAACSWGGERDSASSARQPVLPPEGAGAPVSADHPTAEDIARASATDLARAPNNVDWSGGNAAHGQALFAQHCAICHGGGGTGDGIASPALDPKPRDFTYARFYIDASADNRTGDDVDLARVILYGPGASGGSDAMPAWRQAFSDDDVRDLIAHIRTLARAEENTQRAAAAHPRAGTPPT
ncbi:MAG TPA: cytochrome c [Myxococcota bacterium]|nr:cytochrome c [Myxococcota bacterium]